MAKTDKKQHSELRLLRDRIRELQKENTRLKRQIKAVEKYRHIPENSENEIETEEQQEIEVIKNGVTCPHCARGILEEFEVMPGKCFGTCKICGHRQKM